MARMTKDERRKVVLKLEQMFLASPSSNWTLEYASHLTHLSIRSIQRYFAENGVEFHKRVTQARMEVAREIMTDQPHLTVAEVAKRVGYSSNSQFAKAYRRWYNIPPAHTKKQALATLEAMR